MSARPFPSVFPVLLSIVLLAAMRLPLAAVEIPEPAGIAERHVVQLESPWTNMTTGGAGRYLVFHLAEAGKLALLDVSAGEISNMIDAPGEQLMMAAGLETLIVLVPSQNIAHRYELTTLKREKSFPMPAGSQPAKMVMGSASHGPLVCHSSGPISLLDIRTFKPLTIRGDLLTSGTFGNHGYDVTISGDGQTIVGWIPGISGQHFHVMKLRGNSATISRSAEGYSDGGRYLLPNADGSQFFRNGVAMFDTNLKPLSTDQFDGHALLPCDDPNYFLALQPTQRDTNADVWICVSGTLQRIAVVREVGHVLEGMLWAHRGHWNFMPRVRWLPTASRLVALPAGQEEVRLIRANLRELLQQAGEDYLHIVSAPPATAWIGQPYRYQVEVLASSQEITFKAETAPEGFSLSPAGEVSWTPKSRPVGGIEQVVIAVSTGAKEVFQSFEIFVDRPAGRAAPSPSPHATPQPSADEPETAPDQPPPAAMDQTEPPATAPEPHAPSGVEEPVKISESRLEVPPGEFQVAPGAAFRTHLLLQGDRLTILQADGITPGRTIELPRAYVRIAERDTYYVGVSKDPVAIEQLDKKTLRVTKSVKFHAHEITDLVLHPRRPLAYVAYKATMEFPRYRFLMYNEAKGDGRQSDTYLGTFLAIDPGGRFLMAGYRDIYERGSRLIFNPGRIHAVPDYGSVDWLVRYDLDSQGLPRSGETHEKAGGNGRGIRLSPDGQRVSYLSVVGSPPFSRQLCAWDVRDFEKIPTIFPIKDQASTEHLAYHPFLPWVICLRENAEPLVFHVETGDPQPDKFESLELTGVKMHGLWVAADGKAAILNTSVNGIHYLQRIPFKLSRDQQRACENGYKALAAAASATTARLAPTTTAPAAKILLSELHSLQGGPGKAMTARDVAKWFTDAVVVVKTPDGNGTGMIVGSDGYILTCDHCIADATQIQVSYRRPVDGEIRSVTTEAKLLAVDEAHDLALLKIRVPFPMRTVRFGASDGLESGERVYVIGNPGFSTTILDYTITEGIVSSPSRKLGDHTYIQTSAQVNPGSSGGPMFNENGLVVGQVVLKATIEGAGFATPSDELVSFLVRNTDLSAGLKLQREWMDSSGTRRIAATLEAISDDAIKLHRVDGAEFVVPLDRLSKPDQSFVELLRERLSR